MANRFFENEPERKSGKKKPVKEEVITTAPVEEKTKVVSTEKAVHMAETVKPGSAQENSVTTDQKKEKKKEISEKKAPISKVLPSKSLKKKKNGETKSFYIKAENLSRINEIQEETEASLSDIVNYLLELGYGDYCAGK